jgi:hypothetical protein
MGAPRAGAEAEVERMTVDTAATVTARTTPDDAMEIIIEVVAEPAHVLGAQIETRGAHEEIAAIVMLMRDQGTIAANGITAVKARVQREKGLPH